MVAKAPQDADKACTFCRIVRGEAEAHVVYEDDATLAFLDYRPLLPGHTLVVPKAHHETLVDLPAVLVAPFFGVVRLLAGAVERSLGAEGSFIAVNNRVSQSVPHLHAHVVPRRKGDGLFARGLVWKRQPYKDEATIAEVREALRAALATRATDGGEHDHA